VNVQFLSVTCVVLHTYGYFCSRITLVASDIQLYVLESTPQKCDTAYFGGWVPVIQRKLLSPSFTML